MPYFAKYAKVSHAFFYLALANIDFIVFVYCVIYSMMFMNLFHVLILFVMVFAQFHKNYYNKHIIWMLVFSNFIALSQYLFTLVCEIGSTPIYSIVIGLKPP